jgi:hypothetical protein
MVDSLGLPGRASDADRERAVRTLRDAAVDGRLSYDSFVARLDLALHGKHRRVLTDLVADLPDQGVRAALRNGFTVLTEQLRAKPPQHSTLELPDRRSPLLVVGRRADCDIVLSDTTVSGVHAVLMLYDRQCLVHDRQSTNGTLLNGRRIWGATAIEAGDRVSFGRLTFRLVPPAVAAERHQP